MKFYFKTALISVFLFITQLAIAQNFSSTEAALNKKADRYFRKDSFAVALPLYSQLLSLHPKEPVLSYKFGVCELMADRRNTEMPLRYLEFAVGKPDVDVDVYYYLGYAYQLNYRFTEAIQQFNRFKAVAGNARIKRFDVDRKIEMCNNGKKLLNNISDLYVLEKKVVSAQDFFRSYDFSAFGGSFLAEPEQFKTNLDKKLNDNSFVFYSEKNKVIYFSSYGEGREKDANLDIYRAFQNSLGEWSKPERLSDVINTKYDEDYPFILPDGKSLYFCSKGHNSMGGYDIFKSVYNTMTNIWSEPENLDFAINTPFDDILFVSDSLQHYAYFSSTRNTAEGMLSVYKVRIDRRIKLLPQKEVEKANPKLAFTLNDSTYLNYIKSKANLDVNATEDMFVDIKSTVPVVASSEQHVNNDKSPASNSPASNATNDTSKTKSIAEQTVYNNTQQPIVNAPQTKIIDTIQPSTFNSQTTAQRIENPLDEANSQLKLAEDEEMKYKASENAATKLAADKKTDAHILKAKSDSIVSNSVIISDTSRKNSELIKANAINEISLKLEDESELAESLSSQNKQEYIYKQNEIDSLKVYSGLIKKEQEKGNKDSAVAVLNKMNSLQNRKPRVYDERTKGEEYISKSDAQLKTLAKQEANINNDIADLRKESEDYKHQADLSRDKDAKKAYLSESKSTDSIISLKQHEYKQISVKSEHLKQCNDSAKVKNDMLNEVTTQVSALANQNINENLAEQDKNNKLQVSYTAHASIVTNPQPISNNEQIVPNAVIENAHDTGITTNSENNKENEIAETRLNLEKVNAANAIISKSDKLDKDIHVLQRYSDNSINIAIAKNNQADRFEKQADSIEIHADGNDNAEMRSEQLADTKKLQLQVSTLRDESLAAYKVSQNLNSEIKKRNSVKADVTVQLDKIQQSKDTAAVIAMKNSILKDINNVAEPKIEPNTTINREDINQADSKNEEAKIYSSKAVKSESEVKRLNKRIDSLQKKAANEKNPAKMANLLKEVDKDQEAANQKENEVYTDKTNSDNLLADSRHIKTVAKFQDSLLAQINSNVNITDTIKPDKTQKEKLVTDLSAYEKNNFSQQSANPPISDLSTHQTYRSTNLLTSKSEMQLVNEKVNNIQYNIQSMKIASDSLLNASRTKSKEAVSKGEESMKIIIKAHRTRREKNKDAELAKAEELKNDSASNFEQSVVDKNLSDILANKAKLQQKLLDPVMPEVKQLKASASEENNSNNLSKTNIVIKKLNNKAFDNQNIEHNISNEISAIAINKFKKSKILFNEAKHIQESINKSQKESEILKKEVIKTHNDSTRQVLKQKYLVSQKTTDSLKKVLTEKYKQANEYNFEASALKTQVDYTVSIAKNITDEQKTVKSIEAIQNGELTLENSKNHQIDNSKNQQIITKSKDSIAEKQIQKYDVNINNNQNNFALLRKESNQLKAKIDTAHVKDTTVKVHEYEADYYFRQAVISKKKSDSVTNKKIKAKYLKDANDYELLAIDQQQKAIDIYKEEPQLIKPSVLSSNQPPEIINQQTDNKNNKPTSVTTQPVAYIKADTIDSEHKTDAVPKNITIESKPNIEIAKETNHKSDSLSIKNNKTVKKEINFEVQPVVEVAKSNSVSADTFKKPVYSAKIKDTLNIKPSKVEIIKKTIANSDTINKPIERSANQNIKADSILKIQITKSADIKQNINPISQQTPAPETQAPIELKAKPDIAVNKPAKPKAKIEVEIVKNIKSEPLSITTIGKSEIINKVSVPSVNKPVKPNVPAPLPTAGEKIESVKGLFYSVQIGVYAKPRTEQQLLNIKPLYYEVLNNGNYRYLSGVFNKRDDALIAKNDITRNGFKDAFVVIYMDGKKITSNEEHKLVKDTSMTFAESNPVNIDNENHDDNNGILFKVQIGAFKRPVNIIKSNRYLRTSKIKIGRIQTERGLLLYTAGSYKDFQSSLALKAKIVKSGIKDAFVIALMNNKKIPVPQARKLLKNNKK